MNSSIPARYFSPRALLLLAIFLLVVLGAGGVIGVNNLPGAWYEGLRKPAFNPPNWIFGPVWSTLYVMIAVAGWRVFLAAPRSLAMRLWVAQMVLNWAWSPIWFTFRLLWPAYAVILSILLLILAFIAVTRKSDPVSAWLFAPYAAWVGFASLLNLSIAILN